MLAGSPRFVRAAVPAALAAAILAAAPSHAHAVVVGQVDDFQDGTTQGWAIGLPPGPVNIDTGGPLGAGDAFLRLSADGSADGGRLTSFNQAQWRGDYIAAGVDGIEMDLRNFTTQVLRIRIAFKVSASPGTPGFSTTVAYSLPADGEWHHAVFPISTATMTRIGSTTLDLNTLLQNPVELRILHSTNPSLGGSNIVGQLGIDNIRAIPTPAGAALLPLAALAAFTRRRRT